MPRQPNIIVVLTDTQRWDTCGVHGNPAGLTPNFDRMAVEGTHLFQCFTPQPVCTPARACLFTGQHASTCGVWANGRHLDPGRRTLAHHLNDAGYRTAYFGKWHLAPDGAPDAHGAVPAAYRGGYQRWLGSNSPDTNHGEMPYRTIVYDEEGRRILLPGYRPDALYDAAIRFIDRHRTDSPEQPFHLVVSILEPHVQNRVRAVVAPPGYAERYAGAWMPADLATRAGVDGHWAGLAGGEMAGQMGAYLGAIKRIDEGLGRLFDALASLGIADDTVVAYTSDHGGQFFTRTNDGKNTCHEASIRIPGAITGGPFTGGGRIRQMASLIDLAPTLLDAAGVPVPGDMQGRSLMPLLHGGGAGWKDEILIQTSSYTSGVGRAIRTRRWKYGVSAPCPDLWRSAAVPAYTETSLYDLTYDPHEAVNLAGWASHTEVAATLRGKLLAAMAAAGEAPPEIHPAPPAESSWRSELWPGEAEE